MESFPALLSTLEEINQQYGLSVEKLRAIREEFERAKVCTPVIGKFSSGKSALLNALLGYSTKLLGEDIAPQTAVPTELEYVADEPEKPVTIYSRSEEPVSCSLQDYREMALDANTTDRVHIKLNASKLACFPDVQLVDMPGFESALEVHNRAIDSYLGNSMAYLIAFPVDEMTLHSSTGNILKELCLHEMPLAVVITKCDKEDDDEIYEEKEAALRQSLKKYIGGRQICWCKTSSADGKVESVIRFLEEVQSQAQELRLRKFRLMLRPELDITIGYLQSRLNGAMFSTSELSAEADKLHAETEALNKNLADLFNRFRKQIPPCVDAISGDVRSALSSSENALVAMVMNQQDINEQLNSTVRSALTSGVQQHYLPLVSQYISGASDVGIRMDLDTKVFMGGFNLDKNNMVGKIVAGVVAVFFSLLGGLILNALFKHREKQKREEAKNAIRAELNQRVFPQIIEQVEKCLTDEINRHAQSVERTIQASGDAQRAALKKSLADLRANMEKERQDKDQAADTDRMNLNRLEEMRDAL